MTTQPELPAIVALFPPPEPRLPRVKPGLNATNYALALAKALKRESLSHPVFNILLAAARAQAVRGFATIPQIALDISVTFNAVDQQLRKAGHYFLVDDSTMPKKLTLTTEAIFLLQTVNKHARRYAEHPAP
jgi:hypothetical protein